MSDGPQLPFGPGGGFDLNELMRMLQSEGPLNFEIAGQLARWVALQDDTEAVDEASEGTTAPGLGALGGLGGLGGLNLGAIPSDDPPPGEAEVGLLTELTHTAQINVREATGLGSSLSGEPAVLGRGAWAAEALEGLRPVLTRLAERLGAAAEAGESIEIADEEQPDLSQLLTAVGPILFGVQAGFMVGHLAGLVLSRYEMPLPHAGTPRVEFVLPNLERFETDWELPGEELRFYMALHEAVHAALLSEEWVQARVLGLAEEYVAAFEVDPRTLEDQFGPLDPSDPASMQRALGDPTQFLEAIRPPAQRQIHEQLRTVLALMEGYTDTVLADIGERLIPSFTRIREAGHRHRVERGEAARFLEALLGFDVGRDDYERAATFCAGVEERAGADGLRRLWDDPRNTPTPTEIEAPGLWLERLEIMD